MADVCELAHERTVVECEKLGIEWDAPVKNNDGDEIETKYTPRAQDIFNEIYDGICERTGI